MPLFERGYRASAQTELERKLREIEEKDKVAQTKADFTVSVNSFESNLNFAERINLVSAQQAELMRERAKKATLDHERMYRVEYGDRVDDFENPRERASRYMKMEEAQAEISKARSEKESPEGKTSVQKTNDDMERAK